MKLNLRALFLCFMSALSPVLLHSQTNVVNVESFGASADGYTDNSSAINQAIAATHEGQQLYFPCTRGFNYHVSSPIDFGRLQQAKVQGASASCGVQYWGTGAQAYAFSFVGALNLEVSNLQFSAAASEAPDVVLLLGRTSVPALSGIIRFNNIQVQGYATKALVYSVAAEQNTWLETNLFLQGGGALYAFYTSSSDDLGVANLPTASNLSMWMQNFGMSDTSPTRNASHSLIFDAGWSSGAGNHTYRDGYLSSYGGTGMTVYAKPGYINRMGLTIDSIRFENGYQMFNFAGGGSFAEMAVTNNKASSVSQYLIYLPTTCFDCTFVGNNITEGDPTTSVFGNLTNSHVSEGYAFQVGTSVNSFIANRSTGVLQIASTDGSAQCSAGAEGSMQYLKGGNGSNGVFRICQYQSGNYSWIAH